MRLLKALGYRMLRIVLLLAILLPVLLLLFQRYLIYYPRHYDAADLHALPKSVRRLEYSTSRGKQVSFFVPPVGRSPEQAERIWLMFAGNASLALDWLTFAPEAPYSADGMLLVEYPGYGECEGRSSPRAIEEATEAAFQALLKELGRPAENYKLGVVGISLGSAGALQFSVHHPVDRVILIAPFSTMLEEARRMVGTPLCYLLYHRFDNRAALAQLAARPNPPRVLVFHGSADTTVPAKRSRELAAEFPTLITRTEIPGEDHDTILSAVWPQIAAAMRAR
jgi:pimeloyl-ACP methyl ester carboxylesterase